MPDLIAQSQDASHFWRQPLADNTTFLLGRSTSELAVSWDPQVSRCHARLLWDGQRLHVDRLPEAKNPIYFEGRAVDSCRVQVGQRFVIGTTVFLLMASPDARTESRPTPFSVQSIPRRELQSRKFHEAAQRIDALARLPRLISPATSDTDLARRVAELLLDGIAKASAAAVIEYDPSDGGRHRVLHGEARGRLHTFRPSWRLIRHVAESGEGTLHLWSPQPADGEESWATQQAGVDWAFCLPVEGESRVWYLYVEGGEDRDHTAYRDVAFEDDWKFAEVVATMLANFRAARMWERRHAHVRPFFSPSVLEWLDGESGRGLEPRQADVCVLFCDLRGFSRESEVSADDLLRLLKRVSRTLGVMTTEILAAGGVIGDFHGDAAMGFWGWPLEREDYVADACRAALRIRRRLPPRSSDVDAGLPVFRAGLGLASGEAVAGPIGTADQLKVTVFGPVVNRAARLETLTKTLKASVLLDQATAERLEDSKGAGADWRLRRLGRVELPRMGRVETVYELLPSATEAPEIADEALDDFAAAVAAFEVGDWDRSYELFHRVPHYDAVKDYYVGEIVRHDRRAPPGWDGILRPGTP